MSFNYINNKMIIGGYLISQKEFDNMASLGITHIICLLSLEEHFHDIDYNNKTNIRILCIDTMDDHDLKQTEWHQQILDFTLKALIEPKSCVFIHCAAGISRSALAWYTILRALGFNPVRATTLITTARPGATFWPDYLEGAEEALEKLGYVTKRILTESS